jgi:glycerol-3-phosphate dehydrogenase subunit B
MLLKAQKIVNSYVLANLFERKDFQNQVIKEVKSKLESIKGNHPKRIGFPAVLGMKRPLFIKQSIEEELDLPIFEIPTLPPSIPGIRLKNILVSAIELAGCRIYTGFRTFLPDEDTQNSALGSTLKKVWSEASARFNANPAKNFVLATGGILGGGLFAYSSGLLKETVLNLPVQTPEYRKEWFSSRFLSLDPHPIFRAGISVNSKFQPVNQSGQVIYNNVYAVGSALSNGDYIRERSYDGVALVTGYLTGRQISSGF